MRKSITREIVIKKEKSEIKFLREENEGLLFRIDYCEEENVRLKNIISGMDNERKFSIKEVRGIICMCNDFIGKFRDLMEDLENKYAPLNKYLNNLIEEK